MQTTEMTFERGADARRLLAKSLSAGLLGRTQHVASPKSGESRAASIASLPEEFYDVRQFPERKTMADMAHYFEAHGIKNRYFCRHTDVSRETMTIEGRVCLNFSGYNYLGIAGEQRVADAVKSAVDQYGASASAS